MYVSSIKVVPIVGILLLVADASSLAEIFSSKHNDVAFKSGEEIILLRKFDYNNYTITTDDGYFLQIVRIINPLIENSTTKSPVLFLPGLSISYSFYLSKSRFVRPRKYNSQCPLDSGEIDESDFESIPFMLANAGYDVWMLETRGVGKSDSARHADFDKPNFWNFNLDTITTQDLTAAVKYVKNATSSETIGAVGYSQGGFQLVAGLAEFDYLNEWLKPVVAIGPPTYMRHSSGLAISGTKMLHFLWDATNHGNMAIPSSNKKILKQIVRAKTKFCTLNHHLCQMLANLMYGRMAGPISPTTYSFFEAPSSLQHLNHYYQLARQTEFAKFDYGRKENLRRYGQSNPPRYDVSKITNKYLALFRGESDTLSNLEDTERFLLELKVPYYRDVLIKGAYNHLDLCVGEQVSTLINKPILEVFESLNGCKKLFKRKTVSKSPTQFFKVSPFGLF